MSIENPTLAHFRHFIRRGGFSSLFTNLPAYKAADIYVPIRHYICRERSTNQLLFMQNKPNFQDAQMNVSIYLQTAYENKSNWTLGQNKPNSNPISKYYPKGTGRKKGLWEAAEKAILFFLCRKTGQSRTI